MDNEIPEITNELGRYWDQPTRQTILIDETHAVLSKASFDQLLEYSCTAPSGVYEGKMWKSSKNGLWFLRWYGKSELPDRCSNNSRIILII